PSRTYLGLSGEWLKSKLARGFGIFEFPPSLVLVPAQIRERLDYRERSLAFTVNQLLGREWSLGAKYRVSVAELDDRFLDIPVSVHQNLEAILHQVQLFALFNHPSGFFASAESVWFAQNNEGYSPAEPGDHFWHVNLFGGYRFLRRRAEIGAG